MKDKTEIIKKRYDRVAAIYDFFESPMERFIFSRWRHLLWDDLKGRVLEVGVGTGKNMPYYPKDADVTAIDFSAKMLDRARQRAESLNVKVDLRQMDVQRLNFADNSFDAIVTSCVFCSVPDPVAGLKELHRVCKKDGYMLMLEHVRSEKPMIGVLMDFFNGFVVNLYGANINRDTVSNVKKSGFVILEERNLASDIVKFIKAVPLK